LKQIAETPEEKRVYVDECGIKEHLKREYGYALRGKKVEDAKRGRKFHRVNVVAAVIPLVYDNNKNFNGPAFSDSGYFIVTFSLFSDAFENIAVLPRNGCAVSFSDGCAVLDADAVPPVPRKYLTITNLPANTQELNVSSPNSAENRWSVYVIPYVAIS
jgi:hypothetical protein